MSYRVLLLEPYCGGSHAAWVEGFAANSRNEVVIASLPGHFWRWRMRGASINLADSAREAIAVSGKPDLVLASGMFDLSSWLGLVRNFLGNPPVVLYLHENQLGYPISPGQQEGDEFALVNWRSMVAADEIWCNSRFQIDELIGALPGLLGRSPDASHIRLLDEVVARFSVLPVGVDLSAFSERMEPSRKTDSVPLVLWNHRWEYDKNPKSVFESLVELAGEGIEFSVAIVGENVRSDPWEMEKARTALGDRVVQFGWMPRRDYLDLLRRSDVVVSASHQEYFGISVVEAAAAGAIPVLPHRLSYPEVFPAAWHEAILYKEGSLTARLRTVLVDIPFWRARIAGLAEAMLRYDWSVMACEYDRRIDDLVKKSRLVS